LLHDVILSSTHTSMPLAVEQN